jgi:dihydroorotate dehydrogenase
MSLFWGLLQAGLFQLDPERAHRLSIRLLKAVPTPILAKIAGQGQKRGPDDDLSLAIDFDRIGLHFKNPVGLAAGYDKDAEAVPALSALGFGFVECGSLTPRPQAGNPRPRLFRLAKDRAVINRMGFNNQGHESALARIVNAKRQKIAPLGINLGANKDSPDRIGDYETGIRLFGGVADYFAVNISSPNTPGLRDLQQGDALPALLARLVAARDLYARPNGRPPVPIFLKIAPDLSPDARPMIGQIACESGIEGLIISNTTITRPSALKDAAKDEAGGLSGAPLKDLSAEILADFYRLSGGRLILIGVGGIASGADAYARIRAGASLVALYTALVYEGPGLVNRIKADLAACLKRDGFASVREAIGADHHH